MDFEGVKKKASYITPVSAGVGSMTMAKLMKNTIVGTKRVLKFEEQEVLKPKWCKVATN